MTAPAARGALTSHVLDTALGQPARDVTIRLEVRADVPGAAGAPAAATEVGWTLVAERTTDTDGRVPDLLAGRPLEARTYRLTFETGAYFRAASRPVFYPRVQVEVEVMSPADHHHIPLLLSPFGYSTYRGS
jgi:5-hydroxyisourate hydrolase